jgi:hypothetical protein
MFTRLRLGLRRIDNMTLWHEYLAQYLEDSTSSIGVFSPTSTETRSIYCNALPVSTAVVQPTVTILYPYAGIAPSWAMDGGVLRHPRLNIAVHSTASDGGYQKSIDIRTRLDHAHDLSFPSSTTPVIRFTLVKSLGEPEYLGKDDVGRGYCVTNFDVEYTT